MSFSGLSVKHSASKDVGCTGASSKCDGSRINALIEKYVVNFLSRNSHKSFGKRLKELFSTLACSVVRAEEYASRYSLNKLETSFGKRANRTPNFPPRHFKVGIMLAT